MDDSVLFSRRNFQTNINEELSKRLKNMTKLSINTDIILDLHIKGKYAILTMQNKEISQYIFEKYTHYPENNTVRFFGVGGKEILIVSYDRIRVWLIL